jgi:hypothetical protein
MLVLRGGDCDIHLYYFFDVDEGKNLDVLVERIDRFLGGHSTILETSPGPYHILQPVDAKSLADLFLKDLGRGNKLSIII